MAVYKRGNIYWYKFYFGNKLIRQSAKTKLKTIAKQAEDKHRRRLEMGFNGLSAEDRTERFRTVSAATKETLEWYKLHRPNSVKFVSGAIKHLVEHLGSQMLVEITDGEVGAYQTVRLKEGAAGKTINDEIGVLLRVMGDSGDLIRLKLRKAKRLKLPQRQDIGRALTLHEEARILTMARPGKRNTDTKSPVIYPAIVLGLNTAMRDSEMRHLTWGQIDFFKQVLTVGKSKTAAGSGRTIPLNSAVLGALADHMRWYEEKVGPATAESYVFPFGKARHYDAKNPMKTLKTAWRNVLRKAKVKIRLHDLRHTVITKLAESGASDETIMAIAGHVSRRMLSRYAHIRTEAKRRALEAVATSHETAGPILENDGHKNGHNAQALSN